MRRFFLGVGQAALIGLGAYFAFSDSSPAAVSGGRSSRAPRYGGRAGPAVAPCTPHTNYALWSQQFDNAGWSKSGFGNAAPTVSANAALAPDGTMSADRVQIPITTAAQQSILLQDNGHTGSAISAGVWVKGNGSSASIHLWVYNTVTCVTCPYVDGVWSLCKVENANISSVGRMVIGSDPQTVACGGGDQPAKDFFIWDAEFQDGATLAPGAVATTTAPASGC